MKKVSYIIVAVILALMCKILLKGDYIAFLQWWAVIASIGIIFMPLISLIFANFRDKGYLFSKAIGVALTGYFTWLISSLHIMKFTAAACVVSILVALICNLGIIIWHKKLKKNTQIEMFPFLKQEVFSTIIVQELLFFGVFLLFTYIRCFKPEAYGTEKFMDYGFMTSMMRSDYMPPQDFWFSGTNLNYYYVGQYIATFLTKLSFVKVSNGYNLMLMMVGTFAFVLPYSLIYNVAAHFAKDNAKKRKWIFELSGITAAVAVCIAGNMHYPTYRWFEGAVRKFFGMEANTKGYWFPDATRFIGYHPDTTDKTIHEFPAYSFVLGDLHAHVANIMFVFSVLGLLFAWLCYRRNNQNKNLSYLQEVFHPAIILISFFIGLFHTTNFWDFPIYFVVSGGVILFTNLIVYNFKGKACAITALQGIFVFLFSEVISLPFTLSFDQISTNIRIAEAHTSFNQLIILWGLPIVTVIGFICFIYSDFLKIRKEISKSEIKKRPALLHFLENISNSDLFVLILGLCAIGLILIPEIIYVEDIYSGDYKRANTMFKLTYQAFILFGVCFGYILIRFLAYAKTKRQRFSAAFGMLFLLLTVCYIQNAVNSWFGNIFDMAGFKGLDCTAFMETAMPDDEQATNWLNNNITGMPVVLEANGDSYTDYQRVSVITGLPTLLGWRTHEWLWKGDTTLLDERSADIQTIYTTTDSSVLQGLINKYNISYIYVGKLEQEKFQGINHDLIKSLGTVVYSIPATNEKTYETYIVEVNGN